MRAVVRVLHKQRQRREHRTAGRGGQREQHEHESVAAAHAVAHEGAVVVQTHDAPVAFLGEKYKEENRIIFEVQLCKELAMHTPCVPSSAWTLGSGPRDRWCRTSAARPPIPSARSCRPNDSYNTVCRNILHKYGTHGDVS